MAYTRRCHVFTDSIRQRANNIEPYIRQTRLASFVEPITQAWQDGEMRNMSSTFEGFCNLLGLQNVGPYMQSRQAQKLEDWTEAALDPEGKAVQEEMTRKFQVKHSRTMRTTQQKLTCSIANAIEGHEDNASSLN
jgi:exportin-5